MTASNRQWPVFYLQVIRCFQRPYHSVRRKLVFFVYTWKFGNAHTVSLLYVTLRCSPRALQETRPGSILRQGHWHSVYWSWALGWKLLTWGHHDKVLQLSCLSGDTYWISENLEQGWACLPLRLLGNFSACLQPKQNRGPDESHWASMAWAGGSEHRLHLI